jgi:hypothetical protein
MSSEPNVELLQGTLDLLILKALALGPLHGWRSRNAFSRCRATCSTVNQGSLYPALYRLQDRGMIASEPGVSPEGRKITLYKQTAAERSSSPIAFRRGRRSPRHAQRDSLCVTPRRCGPLESRGDFAPLVGRASLEQTMDAEMRYHIECETAERIRQG